MCGDGKNASIIICGESGAGKTETTKLMLAYLAKVASADTEPAGGGAAHGGGGLAAEDEEALISSRIMESNPLMEAFGNAKTLRNNNSSRFGKFVRLLFDKQNLIVGAGITNYLLEKSRCVRQSAGERNYHIFYQLCAGCSAEEREALSLGAATDFEYLAHSGCVSIPGLDDAAEFQATRQAFRTLGLRHGEDAACLRVLAAVLHLGNVEFEEAGEAGHDDEARVANVDVVAVAASLLDVSPEQLSSALVTRVRGSPSGSVIMTPLNVRQADDCRDALAKAVYGHLFDALIGMINASLEVAEGAWARFMGILDIYGFENLDVNSFEQLFINYANEKLQFLFNESVFVSEEKEYRAEGVEFTRTVFPDNSTCLSLVEAKPAGLMALLDEQCLLGQGSDAKLIANMHAAFGGGKHKCYEEAGPSTKWRARHNNFVVQHYAGPILYVCEGFIDKNRDTLFESLQTLMRGSASPFVASLFPEKAKARTSGGSTGRGRKRSTRAHLHETVAMRFRQGMDALMATITATVPRFVRCIKSNNLQRSDMFEAPVVLRQLKYAGVMAALSMRRSGFPTRLPHMAFLRRYDLLLPNMHVRQDLRAGAVSGPSKEASALVRSIFSRPEVRALCAEAAGGDASAAWALGRTKVFMRCVVRCTCARTPGFARAAAACCCGR